MMTDINISQVERATEKYSIAHAELCGEVGKLKHKVEALERGITRARERHMAAIRAAVKVHTQRKLELATVISSAPHLFREPRTADFHGVEVGLRYSNGNVEIPDEDKTVA